MATTPETKPVEEKAPEEKTTVTESETQDNDNNNSKETEKPTQDSKDSETTSQQSAASVADAQALTTPVPATTVFADPNNFNIKHPLQNTWTLWYDSPQRKTSQQTWGENLKQIMTFRTVEDFWRLFNNIVSASKLQIGSNYHLFKENIEPKWEDDANKNGGKWVFNIPTKYRRESLDKYWLWVVLACIGESFQPDSEICGVVVSIRKQQDRISLWTASCEDAESCTAIGKSLKQTLELAEDQVLGYQAHNDSIRRNSSFNNRNRYEA